MVTQWRPIYDVVQINMAAASIGIDSIVCEILQNYIVALMGS